MKAYIVLLLFTVFGIGVINAQSRLRVEDYLDEIETIVPIDKEIYNDNDLRPYCNRDMSNVLIYTGKIGSERFLIKAVEIPRNSNTFYGYFENMTDDYSLSYSAVKRGNLLYVAMWRRANGTHAILKSNDGIHWSGEAISWGEKMPISMDLGGAKARTSTQGIERVIEEEPNYARATDPITNESNQPSASVRTTEPIRATSYVSVQQVVEPEVLPEFNGGENALYRFISQNLRYPEAALAQEIQGNVIVQFVVEPNGSVSDIKIAKSDNSVFDNEAKRIVRLTNGRWISGKKNGQSVRCQFALPIDFRLQTH